MDENPGRRELLVAVGAGATAVPLAGCTELPTLADDDGGTDLPPACPTSLGFDVEWPDAVTAESTESFVLDYERVYLREVVVDFEKESRLDTYEIGVAVVGDVEAVSDGYEIEVSGGGGIYTPTLRLSAETAPAPADRSVVSFDRVEDDLLVGLLEAAANNPDERPTRHVDSPGETVDRYLDRFESLDDDFGPLEEGGDEGRLYVDVDGTVVELVVQATRFHGDYGFNSWYYVDDHVVRRTGDERVDPREGALLECRRDA